MGRYTLYYFHVVSEGVGREGRGGGSRGVKKSEVGKVLKRKLILAGGPYI